MFLEADLNYCSSTLLSKRKFNYVVKSFASLVINNEFGLASWINFVPMKGLWWFLHKTLKIYLKNKKVSYTLD